jgi:hypothetical protein
MYYTYSVSSLLHNSSHVNDCENDNLWKVKRNTIVVFILENKGSWWRETGWPESRDLEEELIVSFFFTLSKNRPVFQNRRRFTGSIGSLRFTPVPSGFLPVLLTNGFRPSSGPVLCPVHGRTGWPGRSGPVLTTFLLPSNNPSNFKKKKKHSFDQVSILLELSS